MFAVFTTYEYISKVVILYWFMEMCNSESQNCAKMVKTTGPIYDTTKAGQAAIVGLRVTNFHCSTVGHLPHIHTVLNESPRPQTTGPIYDTTPAGQAAIVGLRVTGQWVSPVQSHGSVG